MYKLIKKILSKSTVFFYTGFKKNGLIIYDDFFPSPISGFRLDEFSYILNKIPSSRIIIDSKRTYKYFGRAGEDVSKDINSFFRNNENIQKHRIYVVKKNNDINCKLFYVLFYHNLLKVYKYLFFFRIPFVFTLYPGGDFVINNPKVNKELRKMLSSDLCKAVIVNQLFTKQYLLQNSICKEEKIKLIFGLPLSKKKLLYDTRNKEYYPYKKQYLDICFVGSKYTEKGLDKGYDIFIGIAKELMKNKFIRFHVVGNFTEEDIDVKEIGDRIKFYGTVKSQELNELLSLFDIIVAPNRNNVLAEGAFDGFPVGCCIEASLVGCCIITTDPLFENKYFEEGKEICIVKPEVNDIVRKIEKMIAHPGAIQLMGEAGMMKTKYLYSETLQLEERVKILNGFLKIVD